jgi:hypothetical protein
LSGAPRSEHLTGYVSVRLRIAQDFGKHKLLPAYRKRALSAVSAMALLDRMASRLRRALKRAAGVV